MRCSTASVTRRTCSRPTSVPAPGISSRLLAERGASVLAIEPNQAMREAAEPHPRVEWIAGTAEWTGLDEASIDLVTAFQAFHWFDHAKALNEMVRILRPGGRAAVVYNERDENDPFTAAYGDVVRAYRTDETERRRADALGVFAAFEGWRVRRRTEVRNVQPQDIEGRAGAGAEHVVPAEDRTEGGRAARGDSRAVRATRAGRPRGHGDAHHRRHRRRGRGRRLSMDTTWKRGDHPLEMNSMGDMAIEFRPPIRPITVDEFQKMCDSGIIMPDERVELIDGELIARPSMNPPHASVVMRMQYVLMARLSEHALVWSQLPLVVSDRSEPFPDLTLLRLREDYYCGRLPAGDDQFAVVEISDTMLRFDRGAKLRMYAKAGITDYWIVDVNGKTIEVCREPHEIGYASRTIVAKGGNVAFAAFPDVVFTVDELLG